MGLVGVPSFVEALECPAGKFVLFKEGMAGPLKGFDLVSNSKLRISF